MFDVVPRTQLTLGQFRSLIEGLELYMIDGERIYGRRYREVIFSLLRGGGGTVELGTLAKGDISLIKDGG